MNPSLKSRSPTSPRLLSIVCPAFNEGEHLPVFLAALHTTLQALGQPAELVLVNDGSKDHTLARMVEWHARHPNTTIVDLSRNFGKEIAVTAGLDHARGDAVLVMDTDGQHPVEMIAQLLAFYRDGYDVVVGTRMDRSTDSWLRRSLSRAFYGLMERSGEVPLPANAGDYRLMSRQVVDTIGAMRERHRFLKGMFAWAGFHTMQVPFTPPPRLSGHSTFNFWRLWNLSLEGITSHTLAPLKASTYVGFVAASLALLYAAYIIAKTILYGETVAGFPTLATLILFLGGIQLMVLGVIGEYLGRIFTETKQRPLYVVGQRWESSAPPERAATPEP